MLLNWFLVGDSFVFDTMTLNLRKDLLESFYTTLAVIGQIGKEVFIVARGSHWFHIYSLFNLNPLLHSIGAKSWPLNLYLSGQALNYDYLQVHPELFGKLVRLGGVSNCLVDIVSQVTITRVPVSCLKLYQSCLSMTVKCN